MKKKKTQARWPLSWASFGTRGTSGRSGEKSIYFPSLVEKKMLYKHGMEILQANGKEITGQRLNTKGSFAWSRVVSDKQIDVNFLNDGNRLFTING